MKSFHFRKLSLAAVSALTTCIALICPAYATSSTSTVADINVPAIEGLSQDFISGVDISSALSLEESGVVFKDEKGNPQDIFEILKNAGVNYIRLRIWNDPYTTDGKGYGGGNINADRALELAKRATSAHMKVLVDFHYSDFWADPGKQQVPKAWTKISGDVNKTADAVYSYTKETLEDFRKNNIDVGMVQVGNETNAKIAGITGFANMSTIFNAGSRAVREVYPSAQVTIHFTNPERRTYLSYAQQLDENHVDYDVFASSYYPFWHGTPENLTEQLKSVASTYHKKVMVAETSWAYTLDDGDDDSNTVPSKVTESALHTYDISPQGQADEIRAVAQAVVNVGDNNSDGANDGIGLFYWEPAWLPVGHGGRNNSQLVRTWEKFGSGWATPAAGSYDPSDAGKYWGGSSVDNQALFAFDGTALPSLKTFSYLHSGATTGHIFKTVTPTHIDVNDPENISSLAAQLPHSATIEFKDGTTEQEPVHWNTKPLSWIRGAGTYTITGTTSSGRQARATITVHDSPSINYISNGSFEDKTEDNAWLISGTGASIKWENPSDGERAFGFWSDTEFTFKASRTLTGLDPGEYVLTARGEGAHVGGNTTQNSVILQARSVNDTEVKEAPFSLTGWLQWSDPKIPVTLGSDGTVTVSLIGNLGAGDWGSIDEISLMKTHTAPMLPDSAPLREAISAAKKINLDSYTAESVSTLNDALSNSEILLSGSAYTNDDIVYLHQAVISAINSLQKRPFTNLTIVPHKTSYHVTDVISPDDISVNGVYAAGAGSVELNPSQYSLHYDFSQPGATTVTVSLAASLSAENGNLTETYSVNVTSLASGTSLPCKSLPASSHMRSANNTETAEQHTAHNHNQKSSHQKSMGRHHLALTGLSYTESGIIALCALLISIACFIPRKVHQH